MKQTKVGSTNNEEKKTEKRKLEECKKETEKITSEIKRSKTEEVVCSEHVVIPVINFCYKL